MFFSSILFLASGELLAVAGLFFLNGFQCQALGLTFRKSPSALQRWRENLEINTVRAPWAGFWTHSLSGEEECGHAPPSFGVDFKVLLHLGLSEILVKTRIRVLLVGEAAEQPGCGVRVRLDLHWVIFSSLTKC